MKSNAILVAGLGFGLMNGAFSVMNVLTDSIGPGTVGIKGDSHHFLIVTSLTALAFILLNVSWSVLMSESVEKRDRKLAIFIFTTHFLATTVVSKRLSSAKSTRVTDQKSLITLNYHDISIDADIRK